MKILHIAPNAPYNDYWGYQDNLLPKYQKVLGHDVSVIVTNKTYQNGKLVEIQPCEYTLKDGVKVYRKTIKKILCKKITTLLSYLDIKDALNEIKPDFIFFHGLWSFTIIQVIRYKRRNPKCIIVQDNHQDYFNSKKKNTLGYMLVKWWMRGLNKISIPYVDRVYGVTPWRCQYAEDFFSIPKNKIDLLIMGADDESMKLSEKDKIREDIRKSLNITNTDFVVITGGKIDASKKIDLLAEACSEDSIKLIVFGNIQEDSAGLKSFISEHKNIIYIGWIDSNRVYSYFYAADLAFFPGGHSVLWEQACAAKIPCVFKHWDGIEHLNSGGNSIFLDEISKESIKKTIEELKWTEKYNQMLQTAQSEATDKYRYSQIAIKSLECSSQPS